ncbi:hypothetical protein [Dysgonomonas capnocytophagoides]|uniref:hypothetical protein n=1 Tax=Dysgonomonas capnocytophagoides TaxID=45254 RepID=UPI00291D899F|nr:hypothetical protein DCPSUM001_00900 [Dysgonomonas capnocytophagoides]
METQSQDSAFGFAATLPNEEAIYNHGLTKRELFAAMAMQGLLGNQDMILTTMRVSDDDNLFVSLSKAAVEISDTLIQELNKTTK